MTTPGVLSRLLTRPCTIVQRAPGPPDAYGDPTWTETSTAVLCYAEQLTALEPGDPNYQGETFRFVFGSDVVLDGLDAIDMEGVRFEVVGPPWRATDPRSNVVHHVELRARRTTP